MLGVFTVGVKGQKEQRFTLHLSSANRLLAERAFRDAEGLTVAQEFIQTVINPLSLSI